MSSWTKPTAEQINRALGLLLKPEYAREFFDRLKNPEWIEALREQGFFLTPPPAQFEDGGRTIVLTRWPASRYLARVATEADRSYAETIQRALLAIPEDTNNDTVHEDVITAATALPGDIAAPLVVRETRWLKTTKWFHALIPQRLGPLIVNLLNAGELQVALALTKAALAFHHDPEREQLIGKMDPYDYEQLIDAAIPTFAAVAPIESIRAFSTVLTAALYRLRGRDAVPDDYSHSWRESLTSDHGSDSLENSLATGVIEIARDAAARDKALLPAIITELRARPWSIFRRFELFLLAEHADVATDLARAALTDRAMFDEHSARREYDALLKVTYPLLDEGERRRLFDFIDPGPDVDGYSAFALRWGGRAPTDEEITEYVRNWKRDRLRPIAALVAERYGQLVEGLQDIDVHEEIERLIAARESTPLTAQQLGALAVDDLVAFLRTWTPAEGAISPRADLGDELQAVVRENPARFAADIGRFQDVHPTFVRSVIEGLADVVKVGQAIDWRSVLPFCVWIVEQPRLFGDARKDDLSDPGFSWSRGAVLRLFQAAFGSETSALSADMHDEIWAALHSITSDPDPVAAEGLPTNYDPSTHALNTIRGQAVRTVISYGLWRERQAGRKVENTPEGVAMLAVLNEHLTADEAVGILSLYGEHFPQLLYLFENWARERVNVIFPTEAAAERMWRATWPAYLTFAPPYTSVAVLLREKYLYAASHLDQRYDNWATLADPAEKLIEHVVTLYLRDEIPLDDELMILVCSRSSVEQRSRMIWFTASSLQEADCETSAEAVSRAQRLWNELFAGRSPLPEADELRSFGWFALVKCVPATWFLDQLIMVLATAHGVACEHGVIRRLAAVAEEHPAAAVKATLLFVRASTREFGLEAWRKEIGVILNAAPHADATTRGQAIEVIDYLGQQGIQIEGYRTLIERLTHT